MSGILAVTLRSAGTQYIPPFSERFPRSECYWRYDEDVMMPPENPTRYDTLERDMYLQKATGDIKTIIGRCLMIYGNSVAATPLGKLTERISGAP